MYGYDFPSVRERQDRLEEAARVIAEAGVTRMTMLTQAPWRHGVFRRVNDEVVAAAFA